ncbi:MAG: protein kinase [Planctomycetes bacterium]|nr:protein kinase [Planctomycetota bacterium]
MPELRPEPDEVKAWLRQADDLARQRNWEGCVEAYGRVLGVVPRHPAALQNRGVALAKLTRWDEAIAAFRLVLEIDPANAPAARALEKAIASLARKGIAVVDRLPTLSQTGMPSGTGSMPGTTSAPGAGSTTATGRSVTLPGARTATTLSTPLLGKSVKPPPAAGPAGATPPPPGSPATAAAPPPDQDCDTSAPTQASVTQGTRSSGGVRAPAGAVGIWTPGAVVLGKYEVLRELGQGGMGVVYQVYHREWKMDLVVKCPLPDPRLDRESATLRESRYTREAEAWVALGKHPNVVTALYVLKIDSHPRLFIEYIDGGNLRRWVKLKRTRDLPVLLDLAIQMTRGMAHAHRVGLVHRDLKPENCLLTGEGELKVTDFGSAAFQASMLMDLPDSDEWQLDPEIAKIMGTGKVWQTLTRAGLGTPAYMAPEQFDNAHAVGKAADIYAFGVSLFEMACGRRPFSVDKTSHLPPSVSLGLKHLREQPPDPCAVRPELPREVARLILRCLAKNPTDRYLTFEELENELLDHYVKLTGEPYPRPLVEPMRLRAADLNNRALSFFDLGHPAEALHALEEAHQADPGAATIRCNLLLARVPKAARSAGGRRRLLEEVDLAMRAHEKDARFPLLRAGLVAGWGDAAAALDPLAQALRRSPRPVPVQEETAAALLLAGRAGEARAALDELARGRAGLGARGSCLLAACHLQQGSVEAALAALAREAAQSPRSGDALVDLALLRGAERAPQSLADLRVAAERDPSSLRAAANLLLSLLAVRTGGWEDTAQILVGRIRGVAAETGVAAAALEQASLAGVVGCAPAPGDDGITAAQPPFANGAVQRTKSQLYPFTAVWPTLSANGRALALGGPRGEILLRDLEGEGGWNQVGRAPGVGGSASALRALALAPDGKAVAWALPDGSVHLWSDGRAAVCPTLSSALDPTASVAGSGSGVHRSAAGPLLFSPDGRLLARGGADGRVLLLDRTAGRTCEARGHTGPVTALAFAEDGRFVASGARDGTMRVWDAGTGAAVGTLQEGEAAITAVLICPGGRMAIAADESGGAHAWDLTGAELPAALEAAGSEATALAWVPCARAVAIGQADGSVCLWDPMARAVLQVLEGHGCPVLALRYTAAGEGGRLVAVGVRGVLAWSVPPSELNHPRTAPALTPLHLSVELAQSAAQSRAATAQFDELLDEARKEASGGDLGKAMGLVTEAAKLPGFERDTKLMALRSQIGLRLRPIGVRAHWVRHRLEGHRKTVLAAATPRDARLLATASADWTVRLWDLEEGSSETVLRDHGDAVGALAFSPDGQLLASASADGGVLVWDSGSGQLLRRLERSGGAAGALVFSGDGTFLIAGTEDGYIEVWEPVSGSPVTRTKAAAPVTSIAASPDGALALVGTRDGVVQLWEMPGGCPLSGYPVPGSKRTFSAFSLSGRSVVGVGDGGLMISWLVETEQRRADLRFEPAAHIALARDGRFLLSGGGREFRLWDLTQGKMLRALGPCPEEISCLALTADLRYALSGLADGTVSVWEMEWEYAGVESAAAGGNPSGNR